MKAVADAVGDELLGFHLALEPDLRQIGLLYYVMASSANLAEALQRGTHYSSIVNESIAQKCTVGSSDLSVSLHYVGVSRYLDEHQAEFWFTTLVRMCRQLTGLRLLPIRMRFTHVRTHWSGEFSETTSSLARTPTR